MAKLSIQNLRKTYADDDSGIVAVDDLDLTVSNGEFLVLVGPSGCGKSTILRCISGLESPTDGSILLGDRDVTRENPKNRNMAMVFQNYALYPHMSARENMRFGLKMSTTLNDSAINKKVENAAQKMGITELLEKSPGELSGGQQQRVALGRAIVRDPEVFLMDEPLSNLDAKLRAEMRTELQELQDDLGVTTVYVTHDQTEAMTMGDRIAVLNNGNLQQVGTPLECYYEPSNIFVANFIGSPSINFLDVTLQDEFLRHTEFDLKLSNESIRKCKNASDLVMGVRPEDISRSDGNDANTIPATVKVLEPTGDVVFVNISIGDEDWIVSWDPEEALTLEENMNIDITFNEKSIYLFDRSTGETLKNNNTVESNSPAWHSSESTPKISESR
jgi:multiple sugar transport system ATP-binding protein